MKNSFFIFFSFDKKSLVQLLHIDIAMNLILHKVTDDNILDKLINYIHKYVNVTLDCKKVQMILYCILNR